jgi:TatD DNase family protein
LVDFHCHLDLYPDHEELVRECDRHEVFTLAVTTTPRAWPRNQELASKTKYVRAALGLHPQLVSERATELALWEEFLPRTRYIGEVGLDAGPRFYRSLDLQRQVFERILRRCAAAGGKVLTIHSVRAATPVLDMLEEHLPQGRGTAVLHWFTGTKAEARRAIELGCYFSINIEMLKNERHAGLITGLRQDRLLTETDGPFVKGATGTMRPRDVTHTLGSLARLLGLEADDLATKIQGNLKQLVSV